MGRGRDVPCFQTKSALKQIKVSAVYFFIMQQVVLLLVQSLIYKQNSDHLHKEYLPYSPLFSRDINFAKIFSAHFASL